MGFHQTRSKRRDGAIESHVVKVMLCAAEPSGDALGAALMTALREERADVQFYGCGGRAMAEAGLDSHLEIEKFAVMGPVDALRALPAAYVGAKKLAALAVEEKIDAAILIDSWAFSKLVADQLLKTAPQTRRYKYVAPQVWASRPHRVDALAQRFHGLICLFDFETPWFEKLGVKTIAAGHPGFQKMKAEIDANNENGADFRGRHSLGDAPLLLIAPGSRRMEIAHLSRPFREAADRARETLPALRILISAVTGKEALIDAHFADWGASPLIVAADDKIPAFAAADAALAASGTVTTELAIAGTPMVAAYRGGPITAAWAKRVITSAHASLVNIALDKRIIPEFIQEECTPDALAEAVLPLLTDRKAQERQLSAFPAALDKLGASGAPAAPIAAKALISWISP